MSDLLSGHSHSAWTLPIGAGGSEARDSGESDLEEIEGELAARRGAKGVGYDGEFRQELEGEGGNGVRQWYGTPPCSAVAHSEDKLIRWQRRQLPLD